MGTIDKTTADKIIAGTDYVDETRFLVKYQNMFNGGDAYGQVAFGDNPLRYHQSPACKNPKFIWKHPKETSYPEV